MLTGIRAANIPVGEETTVLKNFVRNMLGNYTDAEFRLAFNLAVAGQLECDANHYENFNCNYISNIMKAFRKYANNILEFAERRMKPEQKTLPPAGYDPMELVNLYYCEFVSGEINWKVVTDKAYDVAFNRCALTLSKEDLVKCITDAKREVLGMYSESKKADEIRALKDIPVETVCNNDDVNHIAKINCLKLWFGRLKEKGVKKIICLDK